jgi:hypothetical protein
VPVRTLTGSFPADSRAAELAYGESWSVVDFIFRHYGKEKMAQLLQAFKTGGFYDDIFRQVLGVDTDGLEVEWRKDVGAKPRAVPTRSASQPTAYPTFGLSTDGSTAPQSVTATPGVLAAQATRAPQPTSAAQSPANPLTTFCGGAFGVIALGLFGATKFGKRAAHR